MTVRFTETVLRDGQQSLIATRLETAAEISDFASSEEDILSYILFPEVAEKFLKKKSKYIFVTPP